MRPSVIVAVRCRPFRKLIKDTIPTVKFKDKTVLLINSISNGPREFDKCDLIFDENASQEKVYKLCGKDVVKQVLNGYDSSIIAYGQTGSGMLA